MPARCNDYSAGQQMISPQTLISVHQVARWQKFDVFDKSHDHDDQKQIILGEIDRQLRLELIIFWQDQQNGSNKISNRKSQILPIA